MATTKNILDALAQYAPPEITQISRPGPRCILASKVGLLVLKEFGIKAEPFAVELSLFNDAWRVWGDADFAGGPSEQLRRGAHLLTNTPNWRGGTLPSLNPATRAPWEGHLVLRVEDWLIDLDLGQMARPTKQIFVPPAMVLKLTDHMVAGSVRHPTSGAETHLAYRPLVAPCADEYVTARDWKKLHEYAETVTAVVRKMKLSLG